MQIAYRTCPPGQTLDKPESKTTATNQTMSSSETCRNLAWHPQLNSHRNRPASQKPTLCQYPPMLRHRTQVQILGLRPRSNSINIPVQTSRLQNHILLIRRARALNMSLRMPMNRRSWGRRIVMGREDNPVHYSQVGGKRDGGMCERQCRAYLDYRIDLGIFRCLRAFLYISCISQNLIRFTHLIYEHFCWIVKFVIQASIFGMQQHRFLQRLRLSNLCMCPGG